MPSTSTDRQFPRVTWPTSTNDNCGKKENGEKRKEKDGRHYRTTLFVREKLTQQSLCEKLTQLAAFGSEEYYCRSSIWSEDHRHPELTLTGNYGPLQTSLRDFFRELLHHIIAALIAESSNLLTVPGVFVRCEAAHVSATDREASSFHFIQGLEKKTRTQIVMRASATYSRSITKQNRTTGPEKEQKHDEPRVPRRRLTVQPVDTPS